MEKETSRHPNRHVCRSLAALLRRRTQRAIKKANHRKTYRFIRTQALGLARQVPMYWAQDPANGLAHYHNNIQNIGYHRNDPTVFFPDSDIVSEASSYQKDVLQDPHIQAFRIATLNCRGLASISNRERIIHTMQKHKIDILCIQESKVNSNSREVHDGYEMFFSSSIKDDDRNKAYDLKRSGTASRDNPEHGRIFRSSIEHLGVGIIFSKKVKPHVLDIQQHSARNLILTLKSQTGPLDIISTYVPQACHKDKAAADDHYAELDLLLNRRYAYSPKLILGDFNARLIKALPHETSAIGPHTLGAHSYELDFLSEAQLDNRSRFVEFCLRHRLVVKNTCFQKTDADLVTHRSVGSNTWQPPWLLHKFGQIDFVLVNDQWKNAVYNVFSTSVHTIHTDHKMLVSDVKFKLKSPQKKTTQRHIRFLRPAPQDILAFNQQMAEKAAAHTPDHEDGFSMDQLNSLLLDSSKHTLPIRPVQQRKDYISAETWQLLEQKWDALQRHYQDRANELNKEITKKVSQEKERHLLDQLEELTSDGYKWQGLKRLRAKFTPSFTKFKDEAGNHVPHSMYPHKAADYLETVQWTPGQNHPGDNRENIPLQDGTFQVSADKFTAAELDFVLGRLKLNKTPGHDGIPAELFKWLDSSNRQLFLDAANSCLLKETMPQHHMNAVVVSIYKKGDSSRLSNYRPISLLTSCYKILAAMVKERLDKGLDSWLMNTQYGFRKKKSTAQAIYLARRLQDIAEKTNARSTLILLDWEKAFDKVSQEKMMETLHRLKVPSRIINLIASFYKDPQFKVSMGEEESSWRRQASGIRQGCPLSPYLFCLVMGALFADVQRELNTPRQKQPMDGIFFSQILYADDTLIFGANTQCVNKLLHAIEKHSKYFGVSLNYDKCINLTANQIQTSVRYASDGPGEGKLVPRKKSAMYLGTMLMDSFDNRGEVSNRLGDCIATCRRMKLFWSKANVSIRWKIQVFNAIIRSKLLYGLECIQLTQAELSRLNSFQNRSLRCILGKPPTFIDRNQTNENMYYEINSIYGCKFQHFSDTWKHAKLKLFGHILRTDRADPLFQVTFSRDGLHPREHGPRRQGRPRADWLIESFRDAYNLVIGNQSVFDPSNVDHLRFVKHLAEQRTYPF